MRGFGLAVPDNLTVDRARDVYQSIREVNVLPFQSKQFASTQTCRRSEQNHDAVRDFQMEQQILNLMDPEPREFFREQCFDGQA